MKKFLPQNEIIYFRFEKSDVDPVQSAYMKMPLLKTIEKIWNLIEPYNQVHTIKDAFLETPVPSFPEDVVREALLNAVVHRDYTLPDSIYVRMFSDRIEISNPGSFIGGVTPNNILTHPPVRRNPLLAEIFQHIGAISTAVASIIMQRTPRETSEILSSMDGVFIERIGAGRGTYYQLTNETLSSIGEKERYTRIKGFSEEQKLQLIKNHLKTNERITNEEAG